MAKLDAIVTLPDGTEATFVGAAERGYPIACQYWALCDHPATHAQSHPVLDAVPCCDRCAARIEALS